MDLKSYMILNHSGGTYVFIISEKQFYIKNSVNHTGTTYKCLNRACKVRIRILSNKNCLPMNKGYKHNHDEVSRVTIEKHLILSDFEKYINKIDPQHLNRLPSIRVLFNTIGKRYPNISLSYKQIQISLQRRLKKLKCIKNCNNIKIEYIQIQQLSQTNIRGIQVETNVRECESTSGVDECFVGEGSKQSNSLDITVNSNTIRTDLIQTTSFSETTHLKVEHNYEELQQINKRNSEKVKTQIVPTAESVVNENTEPTVEPVLNALGRKLLAIKYNKYTEIQSNVEVPEKIVCKVCFAREYDTMFVPCNHLICNECWVTLKDHKYKELKEIYTLRVATMKMKKITCPFCKQIVLSVHKPFFN